MRPLCAADLMQVEPIRLAPDTPFLELQHLFVVAQISGAPVVDDDGTVLGMVSWVDLIRAVDQACDDEIDLDPSTLESRSRSSRASIELGEQLSFLTALDVATTEVVWVRPDAPISQVATIMRAEGIHRVLVGTEGRLVGILTAFDLLKVVGQGQPDAPHAPGAGLR